MKLYGLFGKGSGKLGSSVFAISSGEQIVREYNPVVENPNTPAQVEQRAKFKLLSQLAAALGSIIVIAKQGLVSARNRFVGLNIGKATYAQGTASIDVTKLNITGGSVAFPSVSFEPGPDGIVIALMSAAANGINAVVYAIVESKNDNKLSVLSSVIVENAGAGRTFQASVASLPQKGYVFAYGIRGDVGAALAQYGDYTKEPAAAIATLVAERSEKASALGFTENSVTSI